MKSELTQLASTTMLTVGALFPIVNPLGNAPIFLTLTQGFSSHDRSVLARQIAVNGFLLLVVSILIGTHILAFFGISLPVVQVGGGMVVIGTGWALLQRSDDAEAAAAAPERHTGAIDLSRKAFYPLTLPLTVGPGSLSVAITVGANGGTARENWLAFGSSVLGAAAIAVTIYISYRFAERLARALGETAMDALIRLSSFILLCIGVQIAWNGASQLLRSVFHT
jgi:multiple antibiotic resistance protein